MRKKILACLWLLAFAPFAAAAEDIFVWHKYDSGLGADGYDVAAYFDGGGAVRGDPQFSAEYGGLSWHFTNAARRDKFLANPEKYAPQYGGHCAYAASLNAQAFGSPEEWTVHNGKLYFNYSAPVRARWEIGASERIVKGDAYWREVARARAAAEDG